MLVFVILPNVLICYYLNRHIIECPFYLLVNKRYGKNARFADAKQNLNQIALINRRPRFEFLFEEETLAQDVT